MADSLFELLADQSIRLKTIAPSRTEHIRCPKCDGGSSREMSLSVTVDGDGQGATWTCHRGGCGWADGLRTHQDGKPLQRPSTTYRRPATVPQSVASSRPDWLYDFFAARKISARVVHELSIYGAERTFPNPIGRTNTIVFPYSFDGEIVNQKFRPHPAKNPMLQEKEALPTLYNVDSLGPAPGEIVWVEGEMDVAALHECGVKHAVSLKDGAPATMKPEMDPEAKRFLALRTHADMLDKVPRIVLAGDMDTPGLALREELARRLGRHRCFLVTWPDGAKDAGDALMRYGPDAVLAALAAAEPYPIEGLQRVQAGTLLALRQLPAPRTMTTGCGASDRILKLPAEGRLIVVTGYPASGKTTWVRFVMVHTAANEQRRWAVFSPEMQPWEQFAAECAEAWIRKPFYPTPGVECMTDYDIEQAEAFLSDRMTMLVCDAENHAPTMDWILERAKFAVLRDGVTDLLIDPWNEVEQQREAGSTETEFIGRALQRLKAFGLRYGCNVWVIAHPAKPPALKNGETRGAPGPYDISASAHWANKADLGLTVHSPIAGSAELHLWKSRFRRFGTKTTKAIMDFNIVVGTFDTPLSDPAHAGYQPSNWQDID